jgi:16S rRNA (cytidine1402-2'-O)-methyltransferase
MIFYESPFRVLKTLEQMITFFGPERSCAVSREISKLYEETVRGSLEEVKAHFEKHAPKGEFVMVIAGKSMKDE